MRIAAALVLFVAIASTAVAATSKARVVVVSKSPVTVQGSGFKARERVTVTLMATGTSRKAVRASAKGAFSAKFTGVSLGYCEPYSVRAKGTRGSLAVVHVVPECPNQIALP